MKRKLEFNIDEPQLISTIKLFHYLGLIESIGTTIVDMLVLLLVANGHSFHIERSYGLPRIDHAKSFEDLDSPNSSLGSKIAFLEKNELDFISKFIDRKLRNDIAHLEFNIDKEGKIATNHSDDVRINEKTLKFIKLYISFVFILFETGFHVFLNSCIKEKESKN